MKQIASKNLFEKTKTSSLSLKNRMVMAPMTRARAIDNIPNDLMATYYGQRASAGLIIVEGTAPSPNGLGYARIPGIYSREQVIGWKKVTNAVHNAGGKIFVQLMHVGRVAHTANMPANAEILAPSTIAAKSNMWTDSLGMQPMETPRSMTAQDIDIATKEFVQAALNAIEAGFDGVEIHAANGYLLEQFLNPNSNIRDDEYGGNLANRTRFVLNVINEVIKAIGKEKVGVRISPYGNFNDMQNYDEIPATYNHLAMELQKLDILYLHLIDFAAKSSEEGLMLIRSIRANFKNLLIRNGGYDREKAEQVLIEEDADLVSFGSKFIANPDLPFRLENNIPLTAPDPNSFYTPGANGYTDYSTATIEMVA